MNTFGQYFLAVAALSIVASQATRAQPTESSGAALQRCASVEDAGERLACYDAVAGRKSSEREAVVAADTSKTFGLRATKRAPEARVEAIAGKVVRVGRSQSSRPTVLLDNDQLWELDGLDPLLGPGDDVKIKRGALNSFLLVTPRKRSHTARRLR
jgi:hypothetical protein